MQQVSQIATCELGRLVRSALGSPRYPSRSNLHSLSGTADRTHESVAWAGRRPAPSTPTCPPDNKPISESRRRRGIPTYGTRCRNNDQPNRLQQHHRAWTSGRNGGANVRNIPNRRHPCGRCSLPAARFGGPAPPNRAPADRKLGCRNPRRGISEGLPGSADPRYRLARAELAWARKAKTLARGPGQRPR